ncbi:uncharacterized protein AB675_5163 [Cyphellophora attinorum]|uniref:Uncharacterized protein n=1 Tax=Cyphellophora attinorum TaxID=1664694 RepID=A0A0N1H7Y8_9EURO|nr:uncharacterized protein AB675_5163 [Phialophora attinorum]KPI39310.1 hypothetical protein AB675_5163 [Phialophora attinorum]
MGDIFDRASSKLFRKPPVRERAPPGQHHSDQAKHAAEARRSPHLPNSPNSALSPTHPQQSPYAHPPPSQGHLPQHYPYSPPGQSQQFPAPSQAQHILSPQHIPSPQHTLSPQQTLSPQHTLSPQQTLSPSPGGSSPSGQNAGNALPGSQPLASVPTLHSMEGRDSPSAWALKKRAPKKQVPEEDKPPHWEMEKEEVVESVIEVIGGAAKRM